MKQAAFSALCMMIACVSLVADEADKIAHKKADAMNENLPKIVVKTSLGDVTLELDAARAPITVSNFLAYVDAKFYDGTIFHRVIEKFMIQGGGFTPDMNQKTTRAPIKNEADNGLRNERGTIAMARTMVVDSATAQFFINHADNVFLDHKAPTPREFGYAVFGRVTEGMDVVDKIARTPTGNRSGHQNVPATPVEIIRITRSTGAAE